MCDIRCKNGWWLIDVCAQLQDMERGVDILVATLGWLIIYWRKLESHMSMVHYLALDEANCMLDMGFEIQIHIIFFWWKSTTNDGFCPHLSLCYGIGAHMNNLIVQQNIILICVTLKHHCNCSKRTKKNTNFNENLFIKFHKYRKTTISKILLHQNFQFLLKLWSSNQMI